MTEDYEPPLDTSPEALERLARDHEKVANDPKHLVMGHPHHAKTARVLRELAAERARAAEGEIWGFYEYEYPIYTNRSGAHPELGSRMTVREANGLVESLSVSEAEVARLREALRPFDAAVFNDNGDVTISTGHITRKHWLDLAAALSVGRGQAESDSPK